MLLRKHGLPSEGEVLLCTITKIQPNSVFVKLDEYNDSGMIHISEISPGRIRNIRDYVKEGKKSVCVVLRVNKEKGHIDLSLRRVNESQKKKKIEYIKQEQKAEKIIEHVAHATELKTEQIFSEIMQNISKDYSDLVNFFADIVVDEAKMSDYKINPKYAKALEELIRQRIKPPEVDIEAEFKITSYKPDGVELIQQAFAKVDPDKVKMFYVGGGKYSINLKSSNYKDAEAILEDVKEKVASFLEDNDAAVSFQRITKKK